MKHQHDCKAANKAAKPKPRKTPTKVRIPPRPGGNGPALLIPPAAPLAPAAMADSTAQAPVSAVSVSPVAAAEPLLIEPRALHALATTLARQPPKGIAIGAAAATTAGSGVARAFATMSAVQVEFYSAFIQ